MIKQIFKDITNRKNKRMKPLNEKTVSKLNNLIEKAYYAEKRFK